MAARRRTPSERAARAAGAARRADLERRLANVEELLVTYIGAAKAPPPAAPRAAVASKVIPFPGVVLAPQPQNGPRPPCPVCGYTSVAPHAADFMTTCD